MSQTTEKQAIDPGYVSIFEAPVMKVHFAGQRVVGFSAVCARIQRIALARYAANPASNDMSDAILQMHSLIERQSGDLHPSERRALIREAIHWAKKIVHYGDFGFEIEVGEDTEDEENTVPPLPPNTLGLALNKQTQKQTPVIVPGNMQPGRG